MKLKPLALIFLIAACAPTIKNFERYQKQFLSKSDFLPDATSLEGKAPKVVVFAFDENDNQVATQSQLGSALANNVENVLAQNRLAELVDRKAATKLGKEIQLAEMNKTGSYKGPKVADYAVSGSISNADFTSKYVSGSTYVDPRSLNVISIPPKFNYSSTVSGNIKIYELPSLTVVEAIEFTGKKSRSENVQQKGGVSLGALQIGGEQKSGIERDDGLVRKAAADGIDEAKVAIKNALAKKGYVLEKRTYGSKVIFKISIGSIDGVKHGDEFEVFGQYETQNPITGDNEVERRLIGSGTVTNEIDPKSAWVVLSDSKQEKSVRLGDSVKMKYQKSSMDSLKKFAQNAIE